MTLTSNIYMTRISYMAWKVLTCTILTGLQELSYVTGFKDLIWKIKDAKVIIFDFDVNLFVEIID